MLVVFSGALGDAFLVSESDVSLRVAFLAAFVAGLVVGQWWLLIGTGAVGLVIALLRRLSGETGPDTTAAEWSLYIAFIFTPILLLLQTLGVLIHRRGAKTIRLARSRDSDTH